jgi:hypothetical protein
MTYVEPASVEAAAYGGFIDAIGGIATIVLAIVALAGIASGSIPAIATIVFGAALLIQGGAMLSEYSTSSIRPGRRMLPSSNSVAAASRPCS